MGRCCYCGNLTFKNSGRTFHKFPAKNPKLLEKWLEKLPLKNWKPKETTIICSDHFAADCLDKTGFRTRLHVDSVPTIFDDPRSLCVYCRREQEPHDKKIFFKFPHKSPELLRKWVENMNIPGWWPKAESVLCSRHFEPSTMIFQPGKSGKLKAEGVPTLFLRKTANSSNFEENCENLMEKSAQIEENLMDQSEEIEENSRKIRFKRGKSGKLKAEGVPTLFSTKTANFEGNCENLMEKSAKIEENSMEKSTKMNENSMDQSEEIEENSMDQSAKISENPENFKELNYIEKIDNFDIDRIFLDFPNNKLPFFDESEVPNGNYEISNYCDTEDIFNGLNKRGNEDLIDNKIAEYEKSIEEKERTIELQEKKIKQLQNQISSFKEVIFELCRDRSVSQTISRNFGFIDGEN